MAPARRTLRRVDQYGELRRVVVYPRRGVAGEVVASHCLGLREVPPWPRVALAMHHLATIAVGKQAARAGYERAPRLHRVAHRHGWA